MPAPITWSTCMSLIALLTHCLPLWCQQKTTNFPAGHSLQTLCISVSVISSDPTNIKTKPTSLRQMVDKTNGQKDFTDKDRHLTTGCSITTLKTMKYSTAISGWLNTLITLWSQQKAEKKNSKTFVTSYRHPSPQCDWDVKQVTAASVWISTLL